MIILKKYLTGEFEKYKNENTNHTVGVFCKEHKYITLDLLYSMDKEDMLSILNPTKIGVSNSILKSVKIYSYLWRAIMIIYKPKEFASMRRR